MLKLIAEDYIKLEHLETVKPLYHELVEKTQLEPDCLAYNLFVDQKDPGHFIFIEEWPNELALEKHCNSEHFTRLVPLINSYQSKPGTFLRVDAFQK
ncbi:putative quinol monooxygenase [Carnobacterium maltaromaticum]|uniref:putative quinol monooxygenase n=1 Tax=Carnobacterium maltaromaticum TaxID=2751 RepID=UPI001071E4B7|nr:putative quinol monooxygenase [Carnobacterium maltaromaticum]TFJ76518.1 antibiotic biosynthesis monooxygenase [Carnobacterium maltaromaticum]TFJ79318.1 antibiotic biosynthesis monooxygenase [Carnobacterium maltaromaticum]